MAVFRLNDAQVQIFMKGSNGLVWQDINRRGNNVLNEAIVRCPRNNGTLVQSLKKEMLLVDGQPVARVGSNLKYAVYVHEGTGIYGKRGRPIVPVNKKALRWPKTNNSGSGRRRYRGGKTSQYVFSKKSKGVKGRPFLRQALRVANR